MGRPKALTSKVRGRSHSRGRGLTTLRSINLNPFAGLSFHPLETILYMSSMLSFLVIPQPLWAYHTARVALVLAPVEGHSGYNLSSIASDHWIHHTKVGRKAGAKDGRARAYEVFFARSLACAMVARGTSSITTSAPTSWAFQYGTRSWVPPTPSGKNGEPRRAHSAPPRRQPSPRPIDVL